MKVFKIALTVDEKWWEAIQNLTEEIYETEFCRLDSVEEDSTSQLSYSWNEMANLTHNKQVAWFEWCSCEEQIDFPYEDCPREVK